MFSCFDSQINSQSYRRHYQIILLAHIGNEKNLIICLFENLINFWYGYEIFLISKPQLHLLPHNNYLSKQVFYSKIVFDKFKSRTLKKVFCLISGFKQRRFVRMQTDTPLKQIIQNIMSDP